MSPTRKIWEQQPSEVKPGRASRFRKIIEENADGILVIDQEGIVRFVNQAAEHMLGQSADELVDSLLGFPIVSKQMVEIDLVCRNGEPAVAEMHVTESEWEGEPVYLATLRDITARKQARAKVKHLNRMLHAIRNVNQLIVREKDRYRLIRGACEKLTETRGYHNAWIALFDETGALTETAQVGLDEGFLAIVEELKCDRLTACAQKAMAQSEVVMMESLLDICEDCVLSTHTISLKGMSVRLEHAGKIYGLLTICTPSHFAIDEEESALLQEVAGDIAFALHNIELEEERHRAEAQKQVALEALRQSERQKNLILNATAEMVAYYDTELRVIWANRTSGVSVSKSPHDLVGLHCYEVWNQLDEPCPGCPVLKARDEKTPQQSERQTPDGRYWYLRGYPILNEDEEVIGLVEFGQDITERKHADDQLRRALAEKTTLLHELYHRTRNNMQIICTLLDFQADYIDDVHALQAFEEIKNRIQSMALVHQKLYQSRDLSHINMRDYIRDLAELLIQTYQISSSQVSLNFDMENVFVLIDVAIPCGLILNELISNALQHAFPANRAGTLDVQLRHLEPDLIELQVADNGVGVPPSFDFRRDGRLGLQTIFTLGEKQLRGQVQCESCDGVTCKLRFKDNLYTQRL